MASDSTTTKLVGRRTLQQGPDLHATIGENIDKATGQASTSAVSELGGNQPTEYTRLHCGIADPMANKCTKCLRRVPAGFLIPFVSCGVQPDGHNSHVKGKCREGNCLWRCNTNKWWRKRQVTKTTRKGNLTPSRSDLLQFVEERSEETVRGILREVSNGVSTWMSSSPISFVVSFLFDAYVWVYVLLEDLLLVQYELMKGDEWSRLGVTLCFVIICTDQFNINPRDCWWSIMLVEGFQQDLDNWSFESYHLHSVRSIESWFEKLILMIMFWSAGNDWRVLLQPLYILSKTYWRPPVWPLCGAVSTTTITRGTCTLSSNKLGLKRLHSWSRIQPDGHLCYRPLHSTTSQIHVSFFIFL